MFIILFNSAIILINTYYNVQNRYKYTCIKLQTLQLYPQFAVSSSQHNVASSTFPSRIVFLGFVIYLVLCTLVTVCTVCVGIIALMCVHAYSSVCSLSAVQIQTEHLNPQGTVSTELSWSTEESCSGIVQNVP